METLKVFRKSMPYLGAAELPTSISSRLDSISAVKSVPKSVLQFHDLFDRRKVQLQARVSGRYQQARVNHSLRQHTCVSTTW